MDDPQVIMDDHQEVMTPSDNRESDDDEGGVQTDGRLMEQVL